MLILESCQYIRQHRVLNSELPSLCTSIAGVVSWEDSRIVAEMAVGEVRAPRALLFRVRALVVHCDMPRLEMLRRDVAAGMFRLSPSRLRVLGDAVAEADFPYAPIFVAI